MRQAAKLAIISDQYRKSHGLQITDALIAAAAVLNHAELWTRNRKHYPMKELSFY